MKKKSVIELAIEHKQIVLSIITLLVIMGIYAFFNMPRNEFPEFTIREGLITGYYPGATSKEVDEQLTKKVEAYLFSFEEVDKTKTYSYSKDGLMFIYVEVTEKPGKLQTATFWNRLKHGIIQLQEQLPAGVKGIVVNSDFGNTSAVLLSVESKTRPYKDLEKYVRSIEDEIRKIPDLSKISHSGSLPEQIGIYIDNNKLASYGINISKVMQAIQDQGNISSTGPLKGDVNDMPVHINSYYNSESDLAGQIIHVDNKGNVVRLKDIANIKREYEDPDSYSTTDGTKCIVISMEMLPGKNIVQFGSELDKHMAVFEKNLPADIKLTKIADQPKVVDDSISHFMREFGIALVSVIIVTLLLLPFRIAGVAGATIPVTILSTLAIMYVAGIELDTVTLAALIIVLGIVVDDPIVVIDNHVEKLDHGFSVMDAAIGSAKELFPSVFTATLAISATFAPLMLFLTGTAKDFISVFPITIVIALTLSLAISMLVVPFINTLLIKKGLHDPAKEKKNVKDKKRSMLDRLQDFYNGHLQNAFKHYKITVFLAIASVAAGVIFLAMVSQQLFPKVERNQFAMEINLPSGYNLTQTDSVVKKIEKIMAKDKRIEHYTSFIGSSSPRFQTVYAPNLPSPNYAQILVNTTTEETTEEVLKEYQVKYSNMIPDAYLRMKQLSMIGTPAPIEVRISGDSISDLKNVAQKVEDIVRNARDVIWVRTDYQQMQQGFKLTLKPDEASRLGFTRKDLSDALAINLQGIAATDIWEGDYDVNVKLKTAKDQRNKSSDMANMYITSPTTNAVVPIRQIAEITPDWTQGQIGHRNGLHTVTVQIDIDKDAVPSEVLSKFKPRIDSLKLTGGVFIGYGGEREKMLENIGPMGLSLLMSVTLIFFILLIHFKSLKHAGLSLMTMPLSLFGAGLGLLLLHYPVGFTSFIGLLSLCGIVVRNGIILTDFAGEMRTQEGMNVMDAAIHAGERRMRPIFLTSSAAAVGVIPMILSRSSLWGPLGTVICFGLLFSMVLTLFVLPVLYWLFFRKEDEESSKKDQKKVSVH